MLDKTLGYVLCCQSPALFLAALVLIIHYFAARRKHRFKAVLKLLLGIVCAVGGVVLYYLGMYHEYFTIRDFYQIRLSGWIGFGIVALLTLASLVRAFFRARRSGSRAAGAHAGAGRANRRGGDNGRVPGITHVKRALFPREQRSFYMCTQCSPQPKVGLGEGWDCLPVI